MDINTINNITLYRSGDSYVVQCNTTIQTFPCPQQSQRSIYISHTQISIRIFPLCSLSWLWCVDNISLPVALFLSTKIPTKKNITLYALLCLLACYRAAHNPQYICNLKPVRQGTANNNNNQIILVYVSVLFLLSLSSYFFLYFTLLGDFFVLFLFYFFLIRERSVLMLLLAG